MKNPSPTRFPFAVIIDGEASSRHQTSEAAHKEASRMHCRNYPDRVVEIYTGDFDAPTWRTSDRTLLS